MKSLNRNCYISISDLGFNPIAHHEKTQREKAAMETAPESRVVEGSDSDFVSGDSVIVSGSCPEEVLCPDRHIHIYAESGPHRSKICLNGNEVCCFTKWMKSCELSILMIVKKVCVDLYCNQCSHNNILYNLNLQTLIKANSRVKNQAWNCDMLGGFC